MLAMTVVAIPNAGLWVFTGFTRDDTPDVHKPVTWIAAIIAFLLLSVPFAVVPTVLSVFIGRGRSVARVTAVVRLTSQGLCCGLVGAAFPAGVAVGAESGSGSVTLDFILGGSLLVISLPSVIAAIMLVLPSSNAHFRAMEGARGCNRPLTLAVFLTEAAAVFLTEARAGGEVGWATISASTTSTRRPRGA